MDICFCCLGTTIKKAKSKENFEKIDKDYPLRLAQWFKEVSPRGHFIIVTAMGANAQSSVFYNKVKGEVEEGLRGLGLGGLSILRPSLLLGEREEQRFLEALGQKILPLIPAPQNYKPIKGAQVAEKMLEIAKSGLPINQPKIYLNSELLKTN